LTKRLQKKALTLVFGAGRKRVTTAPGSDKGKKMHLAYDKKEGDPAGSPKAGLPSSKGKQAASPDLGGGKKGGSSKKRKGVHPKAVHPREGKSGIQC